MLYLWHPNYLRNDAANVCQRGFLTLLVFVLPLCAHAELEGFDIVRVDPQWVDDTYHVNAVVSYTLSPEALEALKSGVTLGFRVDLIIKQEKRYWLDENVAVLKQQYRLRYHALSDQYILTNVNSGAVNNFPTLSGALTVMGNIIALPVIDRNMLGSSPNYIARMRARLELDELPTPLRLLSYVKPGWRLASEWRTWNVTLSND